MEQSSDEGMETLPQEEGEVSKTGSLKWIQANYAAFPEHAVEGGTLAGETVYIGRVAGYHHFKISDNLIPCIVMKNSKTCLYIEPKATYESKGRSNYEVLVCPNAPEVLEWVDCTGDSIPPNAVEGGFENPGEPYYIGRIKCQHGRKKDWVHGKVDPRVGELIVGTGEDRVVVTFKEFKILVLKGEGEIIEEISKQTLDNVSYNTSAMKHTTIPGVALANVCLQNVSPLPEKIKTNASYIVTETFSWFKEESGENLYNAPATDLKCGVPFFSFGESDILRVTPQGILPGQLLKLDEESPTDLYKYYNPHNVEPPVKMVMVAGSFPPDIPNGRNFERVVLENILATIPWGHPIKRQMTRNQELSANIPPRTALTVVVQGTKHILEVPYVANLSKVYKNGMTAEEEYHGTFKSTWFSDIGIAFKNETVI